MQSPCVSRKRNWLELVSTTGAHLGPEILLFFCKSSRIFTIKNFWREDYFVIFNVFFITHNSSVTGIKFLYYEYDCIHRFLGLKIRSDLKRLLQRIYIFRLVMFSPVTLNFFTTKNSFNYFSPKTLCLEIIYLQNSIYGATTFIFPMG